MTIASGQLATAADVNNALDEKAEFQTQVDVTASRAHNTVYQNTTGYAMHVMVTAYFSNCYYAVGSTSSPSYIAYFASDSTSHPKAVSFMVPPGYYYKVIGNSFTLLYWVETY